MKNILYYTNAASEKKNAASERVMSMSFVSDKCCLTRKSDIRILP